MFFSSLSLVKFAVFMFSVLINKIKGVFCDQCSTFKVYKKMDGG